MTKSNKIRLKAFVRYVRMWLDTDRGQITKKIVRYLFQGGVFLILLYQLNNIGWGSFFSNLPAEPLFYVFFLLIYFVLPVSLVFSYRTVWKFGFWESFLVFIKKQVFNKYVMEYTGELVVYKFFKERLNLAKKEIMKGVKDNNIISSAASTVVTFGLLIIFVLTGQAELGSFFERYTWVQFLLAGTFIVIVALLLYRYRSYILTLSGKPAWTIFALQSFRVFIVFALQVGQWMVVMPEVSFNVWATFLSLRIIIRTIPLIPHEDILFVSAGIELSRIMEIPTAQLSGLLLAHTVLERLFNLCFYTGIILMERFKKQRETVGL